MEIVITDAGRSKSKRSKQRGDCVVRTLALVCGYDYDTAYDLMAKAGRKCSNGMSNAQMKKWLDNSDKFVKFSFPAIKGEKRMNLRNFADKYNTGNWFVSMAGHVLAVIEGKVMDDFRPNLNMCVYTAWRRK